MKSIDFYFDYASPFGYLAATRVGALAARHARTVNWYPILLGAVFKTTGSPVVATMPLKGEYTAHDALRSARYHGIPYRMPSKFPISSQAPARMTLWVRGQAPDKTEAAVLALYRAYFLDDLDISSAEVAAGVLGKAGFDPAAALASAQDEAIKTQLKTEVEAAIARKVFGSPMMFIDNEPFWGLDRLDQMERWLQNGGF